MAKRLIGTLLLVLSAAAVAQGQPWTTGTISYDAAGNITAMGADTFVYDTAGRLVRGTADQQRTGGSNRQEYSYDALGNRLTMTRVGADCVGGCPNSTVTVSTTSNQITDHGATYEAGNLKTLDGFSYEYDGAGMVRHQSKPDTIDWQFVYTADDERLATYTGNGNWQFTVRDLDGKVLREVLASPGPFSTTTWTWDRDHVYRDGLLLATKTAGGQEQFHLDHLGSPRLVTNASGQQVGLHAYYPFGDELLLTPAENPTERMKFTGHERDTNTSENSFDYMHARFYSPTVGRFLSVDPLPGSPRRPQSWNRYAYVANTPLTYVDPAGLCEQKPDEPPCSDFTITVSAKEPTWLEHEMTMANIAAVNELRTFFSSIRLSMMLMSVTHKMMTSPIERGQQLGSAALAHAMCPNPAVKCGIVFFGESPVLAEAGAAAEITGIGAADRAALEQTITRIEQGESLPFRNDGSVFRNLEGRLPGQPGGYYREYVHPTAGVNGPGAQRVVVGSNGEVYYTPDHYQTFIRVK